MFQCHILLRDHSPSREGCCAPSQKIFSILDRAVPEFGSGQNPAFFTNPAPAKIGPDLKVCRIWKTFIKYKFE